MRRPSVTWNFSVAWDGRGDISERDTCERTDAGQRGSRPVRHAVPAIFLIGGPAFSGTTLLSQLLTRDAVVCLDEPDFHDDRQRHRGIPVLQRLYPEARFPEVPKQSLEIPAAVELLACCQRALGPVRLGMKTCNQTFLSYANVFLERGEPVVAMIRDIRDALVRPLPPWVSEASLACAYPGHLGSPRTSFPAGAL